MQTDNSKLLLSHDGEVRIAHRPYKQSEFDEVYCHKEQGKKQISETFKEKLKPRLNLGNVLVSIFPILDWLPKYSWKTDFIQDMIAGFTVAVLHIPQGMAYSSLGGVPPITGIYMAIFPVIIYMLMGSSRHLSMGTFSVVCMMTGKSVYTYADPRYFGAQSIHIVANGTASAPTEVVPLGLSPVQVASAVCITVGFWHLILGMLRLGAFSVLMSDIMISGFTTGTAFLVILSQIKHVFGFKIKNYTGPFNVIYTLMEVAQNISKTNYVATAVVVILVTVLLIYNDFLKTKVQKKVHFPIPTEMIVIVAGSVISSYLDAESTYKISTVGKIPIGLPSPRSPPFYLVPKLIVDGLMISIVAFSVNISMASILSKRNYKVDSNQELVASGVANIFGSFFSCIPFASSLSRSLIQLQVGGKTQLTSGISCILLVLILLFIGPFFETLPHCVLTALVIVAVRGMLNQFSDLKLALKESYAEACVWCLTFSAVVLLDVDYGLATGVLCSLLFVVITGQKVMVYKLGRLSNTNIYIEREFYEAATDIPDVVILKIIGGLNFVNTRKVFKKISKLAAIPSTYPKHIILDMMAVSSVDTTIVKSLLQLYQELDEQGISLHIVKIIEPVREIFIRCKFFNKFPVSQLYPTVHDAVLNTQEF